MNKFILWSGIFHKTLASFHPKLKLGQSRELFAAAIGHNSYASLRQHDLQSLESVAKYVLLDSNAVLLRATDIGVHLTVDQWWAVFCQLTPGRVSGSCWIGEEKLMLSAARAVFEDTSCSLYHQIADAIGMKDGHWAISAEGFPFEHSAPGELRVLVRGCVQAFSEEQALSTPVMAEICFPIVGRRLYGEGRLENAVKTGDAQPYEQVFEGEVYGA